MRNNNNNLMSKLRISHQAPTVKRWVCRGPQTAAVPSKIDEFDGGGQDVVVQKGKQGGLEVHRNVPYEFAIMLSR